MRKSGKMTNAALRQPGNQLVTGLQAEINYSFEYNQKQGSSCKENYLNSSIYATKPVVLMSIAMIGLRLALSALFWDRSVHAYEDLLDCAPKSELHQVKKKKDKKYLNNYKKIEFLFKGLASFDIKISYYFIYYVFMESILCFKLTRYDSNGYIY